MTRKLRRAEPGKCSNQGKHPMCTRRNVAMCVLYENPYRAPGPCSRMPDEVIRIKRPPAPKKFCLKELTSGKGPLTDRLCRFLFIKEINPERRAELDKDLLEYASKGDLIGVRGALFLGADPNARDENWMTPLMRIADAPMTRLTDWGDGIANKDRLLWTAATLLSYDPYLDAEDNQGRTALAIAFKNRFKELTLMIAEKRIEN